MIEVTISDGSNIKIDDDMLELFNRNSWHRDTAGYIRRSTHVGGKKAYFWLHRVVAKAATGQVVDHIDGDKNNNTRANLRICTIGENHHNLKKRKGAFSSEFKGVTFVRGKWQATIRANKKSHYLGAFDNEHEAAHAYNKAAICLHGEFASLNPVGARSADKGEEKK